jgi:hypothetical protein
MDFSFFFVGPSFYFQELSGVSVVLLISKLWVFIIVILNGSCLILIVIGVNFLNLP